MQSAKKNVKKAQAINEKLLDAVYRDIRKSTLIFYKYIPTYIIAYSI